MHDHQAGRIAELTRQGQAAAVALARRIGLPGDDPVVMSSRGNLLVHLAPAPVVARVATLTAWSRHDPFAWLAREITVASYVSSRGGPAVPPAPIADPGPHWQDGLAISLWSWIPASPRRPSPAETGAALARLHRIARDCPAALGDLSPAREQISDGLDVLERESLLDGPTLSALRAAHAEVLSELAGITAEPVVLHGDAHAGNLLCCDDVGDGTGLAGWLWIDMEETCRGPVEWDLATVTEREPEEAETILAAYSAEAGSAPDIEALRPFWRARALEAAVWTLCMAHQYPARYAAVANERLAAVLAS